MDQPSVASLARPPGAGRRRTLSGQQIVRAMKLFRGLAVSQQEVERVVTCMRSEGLVQSDPTTWKLESNDLRSKLDELFTKPDLSLEDTRRSRWVATDSGGYRELVAGFPVVCAC